MNLNVPGRDRQLPVTLNRVDGRIHFKYGFCREMNTEIKNMRGSKYHGFDEQPSKHWSVEDCGRNWFNIKYMAGVNVFAPYEQTIKPIDQGLYPDAYLHQLEGAGDILTVKRKIMAWEMGACKTRTLIMALDQLESVITADDEIYWVGTNGSLREMPGEFWKWKAKRRPEFMSYDALKRVITDWPKGKKAPRFVLFDEFSKAKSGTTQRAEACAILSEGVERDWGDNGFVVGMTGTPSPKDPTDWYNLCEIIRPGWIKEGNIQKFKNTLALMKKEQGQFGAYPKLITWWDDENKCKTCGTPKEYHLDGDHFWQPSVNEVARLYRRLKGLVSVKFKKEVLSFLPDKRFRVEILKPTESILRVAKTILRTSKNTVSALTKLRELSDGFQYVEEPTGMGTCQQCNGSKQINEYYDSAKPDCPLFDIAPEQFDQFSCRRVTCPNCEGSGQAETYSRVTREVSCPKEEYFIDLLENHEDVGRFVCFAGFRGSIDRCVNIAHKAGWAVIRIDARGWHATDYNNNSILVNELFDKSIGDPYLQLFQNDVRYQRVCVVAHPKSGGMGLTLTRSPGIFFYSNSFDGEDRMQAMDRGHRPGMDLNKGLTIYDCIHLPSDKLVLDNLTKKINLQNMTLGVIKTEIETV